MTKFERPEEALSRLETEETYAKLKKEMAGEALELNKRGFEIDDECRINPKTFEALYTKEDIERNERAVNGLENKFRVKAGEIAKKQRGEILEMAKTLGFNRHWFGGKFIAVRTAKYDDYVNGVDNLIIGTETFEPLAAVDTSTAYLTKARELVDKIRGGSLVKYGYGLTEKGAEKKSYRRLPLFIISFRPEEVEEMLENFAGQEEILLKSLKQQSRDFPQLSQMHPEVKAAYTRLQTLFEELASRS